MASQKFSTANKLMLASWAVLLLGGLAHLVPEQLAPLLSWSLWGISVQKALGGVSIYLALYFLLGEE